MFSCYNLKHGFRLCLYAHTAGRLQQCQNYGKKELETVFRLFWNNINQQMMDYQSNRRPEKLRYNANSGRRVDY